MQYQLTSGRGRGLETAMNMEICMNFPGWQYSVCIVTHQCQESNAVLTPWRKGQLEDLYLEPSWPLSCAFLPLADFNL